MHSPTTARTVDFWSVHCYVAPALVAAADWPMLGTLDWQRLDAADPAKTAAALDAAQHWALRVETAQAAVAQAAQDISTSADWAHEARHLRTRRDCAAYIPRVRAS